MKSFVNSDMLLDEVFVGNTQIDYIPLHLSSLKTYRLGNVAYDIDNCQLNNWYKSCYVHKSELELYKKLMQNKYDLDYQDDIDSSIEYAFRPVTRDYPEFGIEGIGFSVDWVDEYTNPNGTRMCFRSQDVDGELQWFTAIWDFNNNAYACESDWHLNLNSVPTHFMIIPRIKLFKL